MGKRIKKTLYIFLKFVLFIIFLFLLKYIFIYFMPFIIGVVIASLINPAVNYLEKKTFFSRGISVVLILFIILSAVIVFLIFVLSYIYLEANHLMHELSINSDIDISIPWIMLQNEKIKNFLSDFSYSLHINRFFADNLNLLLATIRNIVVTLSNGLLNIISKMPQIISVLCLSLITAFFITRDKDKINNFFMSIFPLEWRYKLFEVEKEAVDSVIAFIRAELILILITGIIIAVGLMIFKIPYVLIIALTTAVLDLVPIIGPGLIFIPWILYNMIIGELNLAFRLLCLYTAAAAVRQGAEGKIMGRSMGIHPLAVMIALYTGFKIFGVIGFLIGPSLLVLLSAIYKKGVIKFNL